VADSEGTTMGIQRIEFGRRDAASGCGCDGGACVCGGHDSGGHDSIPTPASRDTAVSATGVELLVDGMTCAHCVTAVTQELSALPEVSSVSVDLVAGGVSRVHVDGPTALDPDAARAAIEEAGYRLHDAAV